MTTVSALTQAFAGVFVYIPYTVNHCAIFYCCNVSVFVFSPYSLGLDYIKSHLKDQAEGNQAESSSASSEEDFFSSIKQTSSQENAKQLETYLGSPGDTMDALKTFPAICNLSLRLNTALPASAACERLFSVAGLIFRPKRARIDHKNFENQLLLRLNKAFW